MNNLKPNFARRCRCGATFILLLITGTATLRAQSATPAAPVASPPTSPLAGMSQDVQDLQRTVSQLSLQVENLQQENENLKKQIPSTQDIKTMIQNAIAESRADTAKDITQADADLRKDIMAAVAKELESYANETNVQLKKLADAIADKPVAAPPVIKRTPLPPNTPIQTYTVKHGDSLAKIAKSFGVSQADIINANPQISDPSKVREGQELAIPVKAGAAVVPVPPASPGN